MVRLQISIVRKDDFLVSIEVVGFGINAWLVFVDRDREGDHQSSTKSSRCHC